jgi:hypothetical protein
LVKTETNEQITYEIAFKNPPSGWLGFFIEFYFAGLEDSVLQATTETNIIPDTYPFPDCRGQGCYGTLL